MPRLSFPNDCALSSCYIRRVCRYAPNDRHKAFCLHASAHHAPHILKSLVHTTCSHLSIFSPKPFHSKSKYTDRASYIFSGSDWDRSSSGISRKCSHDIARRTIRRFAGSSNFRTHNFGGCACAVRTIQRREIGTTSFSLFWRPSCTSLWGASCCYLATRQAISLSLFF